MTTRSKRFGLAVETRRNKRTSRKTHYIGTTRGAGGEGPGGFVVKSSRDYAATLTKGWDEDVQAAVARRRRRRGGAAKGRVIYLLKDGAPVGVLGLHVGASGALMIEFLRTANVLDRLDRLRVLFFLTEAAWEIAGLCGLSTTRLLWTVGSSSEKAVAIQLGFREIKGGKGKRKGKGKRRKPAPSRLELKR